MIRALIKGMPKGLLAPRHWPSWLGFIVWYLLVQLPYSWQYCLARWSYPLLRRNKKRLAMAETNIRLCFPALSETERQALLDENLFSTAMALFETGIAWFWSPKRLRRLYVVRGEENLQRIKDSTQGVLLLSAHFTHLDLGSAMLGQHFVYDGMYSPHRNPVYDYVQKTGRECYAKGLAIPRNNVRAMISQLRKGNKVWYAPDRDLGPKVSIFVPFFNVPAATVTATGKFAQLGRAQIIPFTQRRLERGSGYELIIHPPFENYPTGDEYQDALRVNQFVEQEVAKYPEQYLWAQPRFKTRPAGEAPLYQRR